MYYSQIQGSADRESYNVVSPEFSFKQDLMSFDLDQISQSDLQLFKDDFLSAADIRMDSSTANYNFSTVARNSQYCEILSTPTEPSILESCECNSPITPSTAGYHPSSCPPNGNLATTTGGFEACYPSSWPESSWSYPTYDQQRRNSSYNSGYTYATPTSQDTSQISSSYPLSTSQEIFCPQSYHQQHHNSTSSCSSGGYPGSYLTSSSTPSPAHNGNNHSNSNLHTNAWEQWSYSSGQSSPITLESWSPQPASSSTPMGINCPASSNQLPFLQVGSGVVDSTLFHNPTSAYCREDQICPTTAIITSPKKGNTRKRKERKLQLWEFILNLLNDSTNEAVEWVDQPQGLFRVVSQESLVQSWSTYRNRGHMTFEKLTRTLRFYYPKGFLTKIHGKHNLYKYQYSRLPKPTV